ncbi:MAG: hypothetical protein IT162_11620 [Bryobacterales bacterium]|nr:hypothetical protein [Bryobacterales bacterium]
MSERDRPSLTSLAIKRPLPDRGRPVVSLEDAESALLGAEAPKPPAAPAPPPLAMAAAAASSAAIAPATAPAAAPPPPPPTQASKPSVRTDSHTAVQSPVLPTSLLKAKKKDIKIAWTFKIPHALHQELAAVAHHNGLTMSDIVIEAIQFHLPNFPHPGPRK